MNCSSKDSSLISSDDQSRNHSMLDDTLFVPETKPMSPCKTRWTKFLINPKYMGALAICNMVVSITLLDSYGDFEA